MTAPIHLRKLNSLTAFMAFADWQRAPTHDATMAALFALSHLEPPPACLICRQTATPAMVGWTDTTTFVICRDCADDDELEPKIIAQLSETDVGAPACSPIEAVPAETWTARAARDWIRPAEAQPAA